MNTDDMAMLSFRRFAKAIVILTRQELLQLKNFLDMPEWKAQHPEFGKKSQIVQNRLSEINHVAATLPTFFMHNAERVLPPETYQAILEMAKTDKTNAIRESERKKK